MRAILQEVLNISMIDTNLKTDNLRVLLYVTEANELKGKFL